MNKRTWFPFLLAMALLVQTLPIAGAAERIEERKISIEDLEGYPLPASEDLGGYPLPSTEDLEGYPLPSPEDLEGYPLPSDSGLEGTPSGTDGGSESGSGTESGSEETPPDSGEGTAPEPGTGEYLISFDANGGAGELPESLLVMEGETVRLPDADLFSGYDELFFVGWSPEREAAAPSWVPGDGITPEGDMVLYAVYLPDTAVVLYHVGETTIQEVLSTGTRPASLPPLSEEYSGWADEAGETVNPAELVIWGTRTFTAVPVQGETPPNPPPVERNLSLRKDHVQIMAGYSDSLFYPERQITRAQAAKILYGLLEDPAQERTLFPDMNGGEWYAQEVGSLHTMGLLRGRAGGGFEGDSPITRAEFADILSNMIPAAEGTAREFPDVPSGYWAYGAIQATVAAGLFAGDSDGKFRPDGKLTRAQAAVVFNRLMGRVPDGTVIRNSPNLRLFPDVPANHWAYEQIMEACVVHTCMSNGNGGETWTSITAGPSPVPDGYYSIDGYLFRMYYGLYVRNQTLEGRTYDASGRYTTGNAELDGYLAKIIREKTNSSMSRDQKLRALYLYLRDNHSYLARAHVEKGATGWEDSYALAFFQKGRGNCYSFAAAFYELARALGVNCKAISGAVGKSRQDHGWVEVYTDGKTWLYDPELEMAYRRRGDYRWNLCKFTYETSPFTYYK